MKYKKVKICSLIEEKITAKLWHKNDSYVGLYFQICFTSLFFGFGVWKLHHDFVNAFSKRTQKLTVWMEIIQSLELLITLLGIIATTAEHITELKFQDKKEEFWLFIRQSTLLIRENNFFLFFAVFYCFFWFSKIIWQIVGTNRSDIYGFVLKMTGECFLIEAKLKFSTTVLRIDKCFQALNENLAEELRSPRASKIWINEIEREQDLRLNFRKHCNTHWKICKFVETVNQTFGLRLIFIMINEFHKLMFIPYLLAFNLLKTYLENRISILANILFLCYHAVEMLLLVFLADSASSEANKTEIILCQHLDPSISDETIEEIALYLEKLQIHEANFKIFSLFHLNKQFILSMLGAVTTYMIIFIQLQETLNFNEVSR